MEKIKTLIQNLPISTRQKKDIANYILLLTENRIEKNNIINYLTQIHRELNDDPDFRKDTKRIANQIRTWTYEVFNLIVEIESDKLENSPKLTTEQEKEIYDHIGYFNLYDLCLRYFGRIPDNFDEKPELFLDQKSKILMV